MASEIPTRKHNPLFNVILDLCNVKLFTRALVIGGL